MLSSQPLSQSASPEKEARANRACILALVLGQGDQVRVLPPPPNLVDNTGEGAGVRRAANPSSAHPCVQKGRSTSKGHGSRVLGSEIQRLLKSSSKVAADTLVEVWKLGWRLPRF